METFGCSVSPHLATEPTEPSEEERRKREEETSDLQSSRPLRDRREDEEGIEEGKRKGRGTPNRLWRLWPTVREN